MTVSSERDLAAITIMLNDMPYPSVSVEWGRCFKKSSKTNFIETVRERRFLHPPPEEI